MKSWGTVLLHIASTNFVVSPNPRCGLFNTVCSLPPRLHLFLRDVRVFGSDWVTNEPFASDGQCVSEIGGRSHEKQLKASPERSAFWCANETAGLVNAGTPSVEVLNARSGHPFN